MKTLLFFLLFVQFLLAGHASSQAIDSDVTILESKTYYLLQSKESKNTLIPIIYFIGGPGLDPLNQLPRLKKLSGVLNKRLYVFKRTPIPFKLSDLGPDCQHLLSLYQYWGIKNNRDNVVNVTVKQQLDITRKCIESVSLNENYQIQSLASKTTQTINWIKGQIKGPVILMAESYGARIALRVAEERPDLVNSLIIDSPDLPWVKGYGQKSAHILKSLNTLQNQCRKARLCKKRHKFNSVKSDQIINARPKLTTLFVDGIDTVMYMKPPAHLTAIRLLMRLRSRYNAGVLPFLFASSRNDILNRRLTYLPDSKTNVDGFFSYNLQKCLNYPKELWFDDYLKVKDELSPFGAAFSYLAMRQKVICDALGVKYTNQTLKAPVISSKIPTLVLSGGLDWITPYSVIQQAYDEKKILLYPSLGHVITGEADCSMNDVKIFLDSKKVPRKTSCTRKQTKINFYNTSGRHR